MSYDLFFTAPSPVDLPSAFVNYFAGRRDYEIQGTQAFYQNPDTGVYFCFELQSPDESRAVEEPQSWASFHLNFCRSNVFAQEAEIELQAFVEHFRCRVFDPQYDGMGEGAFSVAGFHAGWNAGNEVACRELVHAGGSADLYLRPGAEVERIWRWNYERRAFQDRVGEGIFVPRISFFRVAAQVCTACVWADGIPIVLPKTDAVLIYRDQFAPRRWFRRKPGVACAPWDIALHHFNPSHQADEPLLHFFPKHSSVSNEIASWIQSLPEASQVQNVALDQILDA
jgi:hypothetical protein